MIKNNNPFDLAKCFKCNKYTCKYHNYRTPFLSKKICNLCLGNKEICYKVKPEVHRVYLCVECFNKNYLQHNFTCDSCWSEHEICLCVTGKNLRDFYPYNLPY